MTTPTTPITAPPSVKLPHDETTENLVLVEEALAEVLEQAKRATVFIEIHQLHYSSQGSGVIVDPGGLILSAGHVVGAPGTPMTVTFDDGRKLAARSLGVSLISDAGMAQIQSDTSLPHVPLAGPDTGSEPDSWCFALGHPGGYDTERGMVLRLGHTVSTNAFTLHSSCEIVGGDSGGPLFDLTGRLIGIHSRVSLDIGQNFHVPTTAFLHQWNLLLSGQILGHGEGFPAAVTGQGNTAANMANVPTKPAPEIRVTGPDDRSVAGIHADGTPLCLGTFLGPAGILVTKASELGEHQNFTVHLYDGSTLAAQLLGNDVNNDLAVLSADPSKSPRPARTLRETPAIGTLVRTADPRVQKIFTGVISARSREIELRGAALGIGYSRTPPKRSGIKISDVFPYSAAETAGLEVGDTITGIDGDPVISQKSFRDTISGLYPGDQITLSLLRGEEKITASVTLGYQSDVHDTQDLNQLLSGETSRRKSGFTRVLQHEIPLPPDAMGSPLTDLEGRTLGINIARFDRVTTYALPAGVVLDAIAQFQD